MRTPVLFSLVFLLAIGLVAGCHKKSMTLEYVVSNDFRGIIKLQSASAVGVELTPVNGRITLVFPASGKLMIKGRLPELEWHKPVARFANGTNIPISGHEVSVPDDAVALRDLGMKNNNTESWYLVGTADQMQDAMNKFYGFEVPKR